MKITFLGTGAADWKREIHGDMEGFRRNSSVLIDSSLLIDPGPDVPDALDVFGKYVMDTHFKDGTYPTNGMFLGNECRAGEGKADFVAVVRKLEALGYKGPFTIEREISGEKQVQDIIAARDIILGA